MTAYQAGIAKFEETGAVVLGVSTDNLPTLSHWSKEELKLTFPLASDFSQRKVSEAYGVLNKPVGVANRATFVIDAEGKIQHIEEGSAAVDPTGAATACTRMRKK
jgi:peroxiredoxin